MPRAALARLTPSTTTLALALAFVGAPRAARAQAVTPAADRPPVATSSVPERRGGVVLGVSYGAGFAGASGYPNNPKLIGAPDFYSSTPLLVGTSASYYLMGALTDYLNVGPMITSASFANDTWKASGLGIGFRLEVFPLYRLAPRFADTALYTQLGIGSTSLQAKGPYPSADGTQSFLGVGVHHELRLFKLLGGHLAAGPQVEYDVVRSLPAEAHWLSVGVRVAWYGGTVLADAKK